MRILPTLAALVLCSACVSTSYESGAPQRGGALAPIFVDVSTDGTYSALGRTYDSPSGLARRLRSEKASVKSDGPIRPVVLRCRERDALDPAERLRYTLVREGVPNVVIQGPRTASARVSE